MAYQVSAASVEWNPPAARLRELTGEMPNSQVTEFVNVAVRTRVGSRSTRLTFVVEDSTNATQPTITRAEYERLAAEQDAFLAETDVVVVDGYIGSDPAFRTRARLPRRPADRRRPEREHHPRAQLGLLRRVQVGRPADVEQHRLRPRRPRAARRLQGHRCPGPADRRAHRRPVGHREDDHDLHHAAGRPRTTSSA